MLGTIALRCRSSSKRSTKSTRTGTTLFVLVRLTSWIVDLAKRAVFMKSDFCSGSLDYEPPCQFHLKSDWSSDRLAFLFRHFATAAYLHSSPPLPGPFPLVVRPSESSPSLPPMSTLSAPADSFGQSLTTHSCSHPATHQPNRPRALHREPDFAGHGL